MTTAPDQRANITQAFLASIVESSDDAIVSKDLDGIIDSWNKGAERMFGYAADEVIGKPVTILIPPHLQDEEATILGRIRSGERIEHYETVRQRKDGALIDISLTISPMRDAEGIIVGASKIARDITGRKVAEALLREQTQRLHALNRLATTISSDLDLERIVQRVTDMATTLTGAKYGAFFYNVRHRDGEAYLLFTLSGAPREAFEKFGLPRATPVFEPTFHGTGVVRSDDIRADPRYGKNPPHRGMPEGHLAGGQLSRGSRHLALRGGDRRAVLRARPSPVFSRKRWRRWPWPSRRTPPWRSTMRGSTPPPRKRCAARSCCSMSSSIA